LSDEEQFGDDESEGEEEQREVERPGSRCGWYGHEGEEDFYLSDEEDEPYRPAERCESRLGFYAEDEDDD